jgi:hypothetical protein
MANEMIARVKAAIADNLDLVVWHGDGEPYAEYDVDRAARAAIEAMREPTEAMTKGAWDRADDNYLNPEAVWCAMIDAALAAGVEAG